MRKRKLSCWNWSGSSYKNSGNLRYGMLYFRGKVHRVHRFFYEIIKGPIPKGLEIDHLCRNTLCFNPEHLEAVTTRINCLRGNSVPAINARKTHCKRGHELYGYNLVKTKKGRECRSCRIALNKISRRKCKNTHHPIKQREE